MSLKRHSISPSLLSDLEQTCLSLRGKIPLFKTTSRKAKNKDDNATVTSTMKEKLVAPPPPVPLRRNFLRNEARLAKVAVAAAAATALHGALIPDVKLHGNASLSDKEENQKTVSSNDGGTFTGFGAMDKDPYVGSSLKRSGKGCYDLRYFLESYEVDYPKSRAFFNLYDDNDDFDEMPPLVSIMETIIEEDEEELEKEDLGS